MSRPDFKTREAILNFPGPVLVISRDRWFIQRFGGVVWKLEQGALLKSEESKQQDFNSDLASI